MLIPMLVVMISGLALAQAQPPVGHWSFDSGVPGFSARDSGSDRHDLIALHKPDSIQTITGVSGKAIRFLGRGFELEAAGSRGAYNFRKATIEAVVQYPGSNAFVFQYARYEPGIARGFWLGFDATGILEFATGNELHSPKWNECKSAHALVPGRIYHIAGVLDDGGLNKVYVDGLEAGSVPMKEYLPYDDRLRVGYGYGDGAFAAYLAGGAVDELKIWDRVLPAEEIRAHYLAIQDTLSKLNPAP